MEAELGGDMEGGDVRRRGGHPDGVAVEPHLEVRLRVHRRVLRRLRAADGWQEQRDEEQRERHRILLRRRRLVSIAFLGQTGKQGVEW